MSNAHYAAGMRQASGNNNCGSKYDFSQEQPKAEVPTTKIDDFVTSSQPPQRQRTGAANKTQRHGNRSASG